LYEFLHPKYVNVFTGSNIVFTITILLLIVEMPLPYISVEKFSIKFQEQGEMVNM